MKTNKEVIQIDSDLRHASVTHTVLDHSFRQDHSVGHFRFLVFLLVNSYQIRYTLSTTTY